MSFQSPPVVPMVLSDDRRKLILDILKCNNAPTASSWHLRGLFSVIVESSLTPNDCMPVTEVLITIFTVVSYMPLDYTQVGWARLLCAHELDS